MEFRIFIDTLIEMDYTKDAFEDLLTICKEIYGEDEEELRKLWEFENTYSQEDAMHWYTRDMCLYRLLNKASRIQNYDIVFAFRVFLTDLAKQLNECHEDEKIMMKYTTDNSLITAYRGLESCGAPRKPTPTPTESESESESGFQKNNFRSRSRSCN
jgi:hypothetical protein